MEKRSREGLGNAMELHRYDMQRNSVDKTSYGKARKRLELHWKSVALYALQRIYGNLIWKKGRNEDEKVHRHKNG